VQFQELYQHLLRSQYGAFRLPAAIRPSVDLRVVPEQGYRLERTRGRRGHSALAANVSSEQLFETYMDLLDCLSSEVDAIVESTHEHQSGAKASRQFCRREVDLPVLKSYLCDYEELLLDDGCISFVVFDDETGAEVQFDEHKVLVVYADDLNPFEEVFQDRGVNRNDRLKLLLEAEHYHCTHRRYRDQMEQLCRQLGMGELVEMS
jgi:hypothetical protein